MVDSVSVNRGIFKGGQHRFDGIPTCSTYAHDRGHLIASISCSPVGSREVNLAIQKRYEANYCRRLLGIWTSTPSQNQVCMVVLVTSSRGQGSRRSVTLIKLITSLWPTLLANRISY